MKDAKATTKSWSNTKIEERNFIIFKHTKNEHDRTPRHPLNNEILRVRKMWA